MINAHANMLAMFVPPNQREARAPTPQHGQRNGRTEFFHVPPPTQALGLVCLSSAAEVGLKPLEPDCIPM